MKTKLSRFGLISLFVLAGNSWLGTRSASAATMLRPEIRWVTQIGTAGYDESAAVAADASGNIYTAGFTSGSLGGVLAGSYDGFITKHSHAGELLWKTQLGTTVNDRIEGLALDTFGNLFVAGYTRGSLSGPHLGGADAYLSKYDPAGDLLWSRQFGTTGMDHARGVSVDRLGNVFVAGHSWGNLGGTNAGREDAFVSKFSTDGDLIWSALTGTSTADYAYGVAADGFGNVYIAGKSDGSLATPNAGADDAFLRKFDSSGTLVWTEQFGTSENDRLLAVVTDAAGNAFVGGDSWGDLLEDNAGIRDMIFAKYSPAGERLWGEQLGTNDDDGAYQLAMGSDGGLYFAGSSEEKMGAVHAGWRDAVVGKFSNGGELLWIEQIGTSEWDQSGGVAVDGLGNVVLAGRTDGSLAATSNGGPDVFVARIVQVPEPATIVLATSGLFALLTLARRRKVRCG
jgi:hypothetical protein